MRALSILVLLCSLYGCDQLTETGSCECTAEPNRAEATYTCIATNLPEGSQLCEDGSGELDCDTGSQVTWSASDLSCNVVYCISSDGQTCDADCSCQELAGER